MQEKRYLSPNEYQDDVWRLSAAIRAGGWRPDLMIALWRGGAPVGICVHEFLKVTGWNIRHIPMKCSSYAGIGKNTGTVAFTCGDDIFNLLLPGDKVLVIDDVFDTGKTALAVKERIEATGAQMRMGCVYWKPLKNQTNLKPDYCVRELGPEWLVFPHEIEGLTHEETKCKSPLIAELIAKLENDFGSKLYLED